MILLKNLSVLLPYLKKYRFRIALAILLTIPVGSLDAFIALALKPYMDVILIEKSVEGTNYIPFMIVFFALIQGLLLYSVTYLNTWVGGKITSDVKGSLFSKLMTNDARFFDHSTSGNILFRYSKDVEIACNGLLNNSRQFLTRIISSVALVGVLFYNSWQLATISLIVLLVSLFPLTQVRKKMREIMSQTVKSGAHVVTHYNEAFNGNRVITSYNLSDYQSGKFQSALKSVFDLNMRLMKKTGIVSPLMHFIISIGIAAVIWMGSYLIVSDQMTPGNFVSFLSALLMLYTPVKTMGNNYNAIQMSLLAMERLKQAMDSKPAVQNPENPIAISAIKDGIEFKDVSFAYTKGKDVLKSINVKINVGETVALVGSSGGGKTTFVNLIPRFYDVTAGSIMIDGKDIRNLDLYDLRDLISIVFQDNFLFAGTVKENIALGKSNVSDDDIFSALEKACLLEFVNSLEKGLDTQIGERGILLSGGQKQRLAIARAFLKDAPIVILDEATSALDNKSEAIVQQAIENLKTDRTVIVIAHRLSTVRNATRILVMHDGRIVEEGGHSALLQNESGFYSLLFSTQIDDIN